MSQARPDLMDLVERCQRFALSLTHESAAAEDLVQDAWFGVLRAGGPWTRPYLFQAIRNRFIDLCRRDQRVGFEELDPDAAPVSEADATADLPIEVRNGALSSALTALRPEERAALFLAFVEGHTAQEISEILGRSRGSVLSLIHRAKAKVRSQFGPNAGMNE
jgi:RNA polymerase sigma-70 factor (ECF subfamily)